jgi:hypothetical protein
MTTPMAVKVFAAAHMSPATFEALCKQDDAERELKRLRPLASTEDRQDFEEMLGVWHEARKDLARVPVRHTDVLFGGEG